MPNAFVVDALNVSLQRMLADDQLLAEVTDALRTPGGLAEVLVERLEVDPELLGMLADIPASLMEAMRAGAVAALEAGQRIHLVFVPSYDHSIQMWDHPTGISIALGMPYPGTAPARDAYRALLDGSQTG